MSSTDKRSVVLTGSGKPLDLDRAIADFCAGKSEAASRQTERETQTEPFGVEKTAEAIRSFIWERENPQTEEIGVQYSIPSGWFDDYRAWVDAHSKYRSFSAFIMELIEEKGLDSVDFYRAANMDRKLFSRLKNEPDYHPSKETAVKCCLALKLDSSQTDHVLSLAGYSLSWTLRYDLAIRYCIQHRIFNVFDVEEVLERLELTAEEQS